MLWPLSFSTVRTCVGGFSTLTPHSNKFFRRSRVDCHGVIEVFLRCAHLQRHREALQDLVHAEANAVDADDLLFRAHADQLHAARLTVRGDRGIHRGKRRFIHFHLIIAVLLTRLRLG